MSILNFIDRFSFKQILSVAILLAILFAVPTTVWLVSQQTKLYSAAHKENLPEGYLAEEEPLGSPSQNPPQVQWVKPFLGKVDDVIIITGKDFGQNPPVKAIYFGSVKADPRDIIKWHDDMIEVMVPDGATSGSITIEEGDKKSSFALPFTIYNTGTQTKVYWQGNSMILENGMNVASAKVLFSDGQGQEAKLEKPQMQTVLFPNLPTKDISHLALYDAGGNLVPFFVNPVDFGF
jgi:hypothetical protein